MPSSLMPDRFTRTVVCNTGPLLALSRLGQVGPLARLFPEVIIPMEVIEELLHTPHGDVAILRRELAQFRQLTTPAEPDPLLSAQLDACESKVLVNGCTGWEAAMAPPLLEGVRRRLFPCDEHIPLSLHFQNLAGLQAQAFTRLSWQD